MIDPLQVLTRRRLIELAGTGYLGLNLGGLLQARTSTRATAVKSKKPIKSCILIFYYGGPSHLETYDLKPGAPAEVRGEFQPVPTVVPGVQISEHLPRMARVMNHVALIRSVTHNARLHDSASIHSLTGRPLDGPDRELFAPLPQVYPCFGSAVARFHKNPNCDVPFASLPFVFHNVVDNPCQGGGILGSAYDPLRIEVDPNQRKYQIELLKRTPGDSNTARRSLLTRLENQAWHPQKRDFYETAYRLLDSPTLHKALDITTEPMKLRERYGFGADPVNIGEGGGGGNGAELAYGRQMRGQNLLLARRLVEAGVPFINVYDFKQQGQNWDAHFKCGNQHKRFLLPQADQGLSALIEDLEIRGLLDTTLIVALGEFGRTPKINGEAGRDHWPDCYTVLMAGGGIHGGAVYGASDRLGAYPAIDPVTPGDIAATIYWRFGIDPGTEIRDQTNRPIRLAAGEPITKIFDI